MPTIRTVALTFSAGCASLLAQDVSYKADDAVCVDAAGRIQLKRDVLGDCGLLEGRKYDGKTFDEQDAWQGTNFLRCGMSGASFAKKRMDGVVLQDSSCDGLDLTNATLRRVRCANGSFQGLLCGDADLQYTWFECAPHGFGLREEQMQDARLNLQSSVFSKCAMRGVHFAACDLAGAEFDLLQGKIEQRQQPECTPDGKPIIGADGKPLTRVVDVPPVTFARCTLQGASFENAVLPGGHFVLSELRETKFEHANVNGAHFVMCQLLGVRLQGASMQGTVWTDCDLTHVSFRGAILDRSKWSDIRAAVGTCFDDVSLVGADFRGVNLAKASLKKANLHSGDIRQADLQGADLRGADLREVKFDDAKLQGATFDDATKLPFSAAEAVQRGMTRAQGG